MKLWNFLFKVHVRRSVAWFLSAPFLLSSSASSATQGIRCHPGLATMVPFSTLLAAGASQNLLAPTNPPEELSTSSFACHRDAAGLMLALLLAPFSPWAEEHQAANRELPPFSCGCSAGICLLFSWCSLDLFFWPFVLPCKQLFLSLRKSSN